MKYGCCLNMVALGPDGIGSEHLEKLKQSGYDYAEIPLAETMALSESEFHGLVQRIRESRIPCEACNNFFPKTMRLTGKQTDLEAIMTYVRAALARARELGAKRVVFGSGPAKMVPPDTSLEEGYHQVVDLLQRIAPVAKEYGIMIVIEPLRKAECNLINTFEEGCRLAEEVGHPAVKVLADYYHMSEEQESVSVLRQYGRKWLSHVHFADPEGRVFPLDFTSGKYQQFFQTLKAIGYNERISVEAYSRRFDQEAGLTLKFLKAAVQ